MAQTGKKINELTAISNVTGETVLPGVYVNSGVADSTANKISISQISAKVQNDMTSTLAGKQDKLTAGDGITIESNVISASGGGGFIGTFIASDGYSAPSNLPAASTVSNQTAIVKRTIVNPYDETQVLTAENAIISNGTNWKFLNDWIFFINDDFNDINSNGSINGISLENGDVCYCKNFNGNTGSEESLYGCDLYTWYITEDIGGLYNILETQHKFWWSSNTPSESGVYPYSFYHFKMDFTNYDDTTLVFNLPYEIHHCQYDIKAGSNDITLSVDNTAAEEIGPLKWFINGKPTTTPILKSGSYSHLFINGTWGEYTGNAIYVEIFTDIDPYPTMVPCTQAEYDTLVQAGTVNSSTLYLIEEESA